MPQLTLEPWFLIFLTTWLSLTLLAPVKILNHTHLNKPYMKNLETLPPVWTWLW